MNISVQIVKFGHLHLPPLQDFSPGWSWWVEHDGDDAGVVGPQLAHVPPLYGAVHKLLARVDPGGTALHATPRKNVRFICLLRLTHCADTVLRGEHVPSSISAQDQASVPVDIQRVNMGVGLRGNYELILLTVP